jgi:hypothetical protein
VTSSTTTTIQGVSIFSRQRKRKTDVFDIALSPEGIVIRRPGRSEQHMTWERISQWEIDERAGCIVLTLRGGGSVTPLMVKGWTLEDLETVMRDATEGASGPADVAGAPVASAADEISHAAPAAAIVPDAAALEAAPVDTAPGHSRAARRRAARRPKRGVWKPLVTIVLLGVLATAVAVVLLQSAGVISWSFLGPVA